MMFAPPPPDEARRLQLLGELAVLDTPPEAGFDGLTRLARSITGWPVALISLIDADRQWFKSHDGLTLRETSRELAFCTHALIQGEDVFEVPDAHTDARFAANPLVAGAPYFRAYAGCPLVVQGVRLGTLCVVHTAPARLQAAQLDQLQALSAAASALLTERLHGTQLAAERARLADFAAASGDWLWETDDRDRVVWLSSGYELAIGRDAASQLGQPLPDLPLVDTRGQPLQPSMSLPQLCARRRAFSRATVALMGFEGERLISLSAVPIRSRDRRRSGMRGSARDVTAQVLAERERDIEAQRLRKLVAQVPGALYQFRMDDQGQACLPFATPGLQTLFEVSPVLAAADAQPVFDRIHPDDLPAILRSIEASRAGLLPWQATFRVQLPHAGERHLSAHSSPQREPDGSVLWHGLVTDVTLEVQERQDRDRLQHERDRAQREAHARAEALSRVSHELRTPLNAILGFTQLMQAALAEGSGPRGIPAARGPDNWAQWVQQVHRASSHLLALVNDVLDLSSLEARRFVVDLQNVDAADLARQVVEMVCPQARLRRQTLTLTEPDESGALPPRSELWVRADKRALRQVLINLLGNACKFTPEGGNIALRLSTVHGRRARLEVCDDGPGISHELRARLFRPFERGPQSNDMPAGTGLGLSVSRQLVLAMRGALTVQSTPGHGSIFAVELPRVADSSLVPPQPPSPDSPFGGLPADPEASVVEMPAALLLYVEDDPVNGLLMQEFVARTPQLRLKLAASLAEGLVAAQTLLPDLVLLDMNLPDGSGVELLRKLRADPATSTLRVVALSADAMPEQIRSALSVGFDEYWTKPVDFKQLRRRLAALLSE